MTDAYARAQTVNDSSNTPDSRKNTLKASKYRHPKDTENHHKAENKRKKRKQAAFHHCK